MMITFIRTFIVYAVALFTIRCMGKTGLSSTDPFQITIMLLIAELAQRNLRYLHRRFLC